jgi:hypothetical protein
MSRPTPNDSGGYASSAGGVVANAFDSDIETICTQSSSDGNISVDYGTDNPVYVGSIGVVPGVSGSFNAVFEWSSDGWLGRNCMHPGLQRGLITNGCGMTSTPGLLLSIIESARLVAIRCHFENYILAITPTEITMARLNRDDYTNLPNKNFTAESAVSVFGLIETSAT